MNAHNHSRHLCENPYVVACVLAVKVMSKVYEIVAIS